jgi:arylsulfatase A-like enzyme
MARYSNVLLLSVDALRHDRVFGPKAVPDLSKLVADAVVLERAWCLYPGTVPSLYGLVTSRPPSSFALTPYQSFEFPSTDRSPTLFEVAESAGIRTAAAVFHGSLAPRFGITRGAGQVWAPGMSGEGVSAAQTTAEALRMLDELRNDRFLLWVHYFDPHAPYDVEPGSPLESASDLDRYDAEIARVADEIPLLLGALRRHGLTDDTVVIFFADHGEEFREHQGVFHGQALYEESVRIPMAFLLPGLPPRTETAPTSLLDIAPTTLELLGLQDRIPRSFAGRSLGALLNASQDAPERSGTARAQRFAPIFPEVFQKGRTRISRSVVQWPWKLIRREDDDAFELYDLESDPAELRNLFDPRPAEAEALQRLLDLYLAIQASTPAL